MKREELSAADLALVEAARSARERAHAPYSRFRVGSALYAGNGELFCGCNVENASYGATVCAERAAVFAMVAGGQSSILSLAVFTDADTLSMPCGVCRQVIAEFAQNTRIVVANFERVRALSFAEIFPEPFVLER